VRGGRAFNREDVMTLQDCALDNIRQKPPAEAPASPASDSRLQRNEAVKDYQDSPRTEQVSFVLSLLRALSAWST